MRIGLEQGAFRREMIGGKVRNKLSQSIQTNIGDIANYWNVLRYKLRAKVAEPRHGM